MIKHDMAPHPDGHHGEECEGCVVEGHLDGLRRAISSIGRGDVHGPTGFELLAMALTGTGPPGDHNSLAQAIRDAGESIGNGLLAVAEALNGDA